MSASPESTEEPGHGADSSMQRRLDELDSSIANATAEVDWLQQKLRQSPFNTAAKLELTRSSNAAAEAPADSWQSLALQASYREDPRSEDPPQRFRYPPFQSGLVHDSHMVKESFRPASSVLEPSVDRLRRRHVERHRLRRGHQLEANLAAPKLHGCTRASKATKSSLERRSLPQQPSAAEEDKQVACSSEPVEESAPPLPLFLQGHPSRHAAALRSGFMASAMQHAFIGSATGHGPLLVPSLDVAGPESTSSRPHRAPTHLEWLAHCDRELAAHTLLGFTGSGHRSLES